jgi:hypothetical protein
MTGGGVITGGMSVKLNRAVMQLDDAFWSDGAERVQIWCKKKCACGRGELAGKRPKKRPKPREASQEI